MTVIGHGMLSSLQRRGFCQLIFISQSAHSCKHRKRSYLNSKLMWIPIMCVSNHKAGVHEIWKLNSFKSLVNDITGLL